jgi:beta-galactosidase
VSHVLPEQSNFRKANGAAVNKKKGIVMTKKVSVLLALAFGLLAGLNPICAVAAETISLAGKWRFALDRADAGLQQQWFGKDLPDRIALPGVLQSQGYGDEISTNTPWVLSLHDRFWYLREDYKAYINPGSVKVPFVCQPPRHYLGAAWYQRDVEIPANWQGRRVVLNLERPHWESAVWLDDRRVGSNNSLCAPHVYDLGTLSPGKHRLSIRVDNRMILPYRADAHSVSDSLGSSWNGIVGRIELTATSLVWIDDAQVFPDVTKKGIHVRAAFHNISGKTAEGKVTYFIEPDLLAAPLKILPSSQNFNTSDTNAALTEELSLGDAARTWDEFSPALYRLRIHIRGDVDGQLFEDDTETVFGLREFKTEGQDFAINGRKTYLRGTHHGGDFALTGYPATDVEYWRKLFRTCREWGLNHMRFHSFCPPEAAFVAADELGFYLQPECGMWNEFNPGSPMEAMLYAETERIIRAYGNHPSLVMLAASNEPKGRWKDVLPKWAQHFRTADARRLYTGGTGFTDADAPGPLDRVDYTATARFGPNRIRGESAWFGRDYSKSLQGVTVPVVSHELGQWCAYPDYDIITKFTGYMRPGNYEIFRDSLAAHGMLAKDKDFARASGRFQLECYKEEVEANLRTPGLGGFQLLDLHDYVGQGTALVGLLDVFWEEKGYATAGEFRRFCSTTVPLARLRNRVFTTADSFDVDVEVAHYGAEPIANAVSVWHITDGAGKVVAKGEWPARTIPIGKNFALGKVTVDLSKLAAPQAYKLVVSLQGTPFTNDWEFWLYPSQASDTAPPDVLVTSSWDEAEPRLAAGGKVLLLPRNTDLDWTSPPLDTVPVFWNRLMNPNWGRMLGLWCDAKHPALAEFPTGAYCDWQWTELTTRRTRAVNLDRLPRELQPIVQAIDDWNRNWKLGLVFESRVGSGRLLVCSIDIASDLANRPVARQLRRSLLDYMAGARFQPQVAVSAAEFRGLWFDSRIMQKLGATIQAPGANPNNVIDGDPNTFWSVGGPGRGGAPAPASNQPRELTITFPAPVAMNGLIFMARQNDRNHAGDVRGYLVEVSDDGQQWREVTRGELASTWNPQQVRFAQTVTKKNLRFTALSGFGNDTSTALAELAVMYAGPKLTEGGLGAVEYQRVRSTSTDVEEGTDASGARTNAPPRRNQ